ncbi:MAG: YcjF family protein [Enterovibrio sp.]
MAEYQKTIFFNEFSDETQFKADVTLKSAQFFTEKSDFLAVDCVEKEAVSEKQLAAKLTTVKKHWGLRCFAMLGAGLLSWQLIAEIQSAFVASDWLTVGWSGFWLGLSTLGFAALGKEFFALQRLRGRQMVREKMQGLISTNGAGNAKKECEKLAKLAGCELMPEYDKWQQVVTPTQTDKDVFELYDSLVLAGLDARAKKIIAKHASEAALLVALSPLAIVDMGLVAWRSVSMLGQISEHYGIKLGYWSKISMLRLVLVNMALAGASELVTDMGSELLSIGIAGKLSGRAAQGLGVGLLTARLGYKAIALMRPLPHLASPVPKLSELRRDLLGQLAGVKR